MLTVALGQRGRVAAGFAVLGAGPRSASRGVTKRWAGADHASVALLENPVRSASPARPRPPMASSTSCYAQSMATARSREDCGLTGVIGRFAATSKGELLFSGSLYRKFRELRGVGWGDRSRKSKSPDHRRPGPSCPLPNPSNRPSLRWYRGHPYLRPDGALVRNERKTSCRVLSIPGGAYGEAIVSRIAVIAANGSYQAGCRYQGVSEALPPCGRVSIRRHGWIFVQMPSEQVRRTPFRL